MESDSAFLKRMAVVIGSRFVRIFKRPNLYLKKPIKFEKLPIRKVKITR